MNRATKLLRSFPSAVGSVVIAFTLAVVTPVGAADKPDASKADADLVRPLKIKVAEAVLRDLKERLARTRFPNGINGAEWEYGVDLKYIQKLVAYWREKYDWRTHV